MFAYVTPTVSVTLFDLDAPGNSFLIQKLMPQPLSPFSSGGKETDELEEQNQTSCLIYLEERDKCTFRLFQGTHINHALEGALGVGKGRGRKCLPAVSAQPSLTSKTVKMSPSHPHQLAPAPTPCEQWENAFNGVAWSEVWHAVLSRGMGLTSLQRVNLCPTVTCDPDLITKVWRRKTTHKFPSMLKFTSTFARITSKLAGKMTKPQFMQQKKLFIWDMHCQYKLRDHKTYTF